MSGDLERFLATAQRCADAAAAVTTGHFRNPVSIDNKAAPGDGYDPVTEADRTAEAAIRAVIEAEYPDHGIFGEEAQAKPAQSEFTWFIDPIDGTRSFVIGVPLWGTLIGLERAERPLLGLIDQPYLGERYCGTPDGATLETARGREAISTSGCTTLAETRLGTTSPFLFGPDERTRYQAVEDRVRLARYGGDCYFYAMLASGHIDLVVESGLEPYDVMAIIPVVEAAGGVITSWTGSAANRGGQVVAAATPALHEAAIGVLSR